MKYIIGISGSIASYKGYDLVRGLVKKGHEVKVVLTSGALEFVKPDTFKYLGADSVFLPTDDFQPSNLLSKQTVLHIELAKWADKLIIAPLSANTLARLSLGLNNDLLGSLYLAFGGKPILLFPAMNTKMWNHGRVQEHLKKLSACSNIIVINPVSGPLACGDVGEGKFPDINAVIDLSETIDPTRNKNKRIIITAGATASPLDPVRFLTNPSSGKMGIEVAKAFLKEGYEVTVLAGHQCTPEVEYLIGHPNFELVHTPTTSSMRDAAIMKFPHCSLYISTGAIADIEFEFVPEKIKKENMGSSLPFKQAPDILKEVLSKKDHQKVVSFAAETETTTEIFMEKMKRKPVDLMIGNKVSNGLTGSGKLEGFQHMDGIYYFVSAAQIQGPFHLTKSEIGRRLVKWFEGESVC